MAAATDRATVAKLSRRYPLRIMFAFVQGHVQHETRIDMNLNRKGIAALLSITLGMCMPAIAEPSRSDDASTPARLGHDYKKIELFQEFRAKLLADGWVPEKNPDCHDAVMGGYYDEYCSKNPTTLSCRLCTLTPELFRRTSDGYMLMKYRKAGVSLGVTLYGDAKDLEHPGEYGLSIVGWDYENGLNVQQLD